MYEHFLSQSYGAEIEIFNTKIHQEFVNQEMNDFLVLNYVFIDFFTHIRG